MGDELNLNIDTYNLEDILELFALKHDFDEDDLKKAKKIVLMTHPDKSGLDSNYFRFYCSAYKVLFFIWEFKNKNTTTKHIEKYDTSERENSSVIPVFLNNEKMKNPKTFNKWFNAEFNKVKVYNEDETHGYGDWFKSNSDIYNDTSSGNHIDQRKHEIKSTIPYKEYSELTSYQGSSNLTGEVPISYAADVFSDLKYDDLYTAYTETVVPVTLEDYENTKKFNNVDDYKKYRNIQNITPPELNVSMQNLETMKVLDEKETTARAYKLAKQLEEVKEKQNYFLSRLLQITL
jgi:hypothetical protein